MPMADAVTNARRRGSPLPAVTLAAASWARRRVGRIRLARISALRSGVNRPPIEAPARWITASTPSSSPRSGSSGCQ